MCLMCMCVLMEGGDNGSVNGVDLILLLVILIWVVFIVSDERFFSWFCSENVCVLKWDVVIV